MISSYFVDPVAFRAVALNSERFFVEVGRHAIVSGIRSRCGAYGYAHRLASITGQSNGVELNGSATAEQG